MIDEQRAVAPFLVQPEGPGRFSRTAALSVAYGEPLHALLPPCCMRKVTSAAAYYETSTGPSDPRVNIQKGSDGNAKAFQVKQVLAAIDKESIQIVDVRSLGQYLGTYKSSKVSEKGHIPTAKLYPIDLVTTRYTPIRFSSKSDLSQLTNALNIDTEQKLPFQSK